MGDGVTEGVGPLFLQYPCDALFIPIRSVSSYPWLSLLPSCFSTSHAIHLSPFYFITAHSFHQLGCVARCRLVPVGDRRLSQRSRSGSAYFSFSFSLGLSRIPFATLYFHCDRLRCACRLDYDRAGCQRRSLLSSLAFSSPFSRISHGFQHCILICTSFVRKPCKSRTLASATPTCCNTIILPANRIRIPSSILV